MITIGSALPDMRAAYNLSDSMSGALLSCYSLGNFASGILSGYAALFLGQKLAIVILSGLVCLGMSLLTFGHMQILLFAACALIGIGRGSMISFGQRTINILTNGNSQVTGMLHSTFAVGAIISPLIFSALRVISWKAGIILVAFLGLIALSIFLSIKDYSVLDNNDDKNKSSSKSERSLEFLRDKGFMIIACLMFLYLCCEYAVNGWLVTYMHYKKMPLTFSHSMASLLWLVMLAGRLLCVWMTKYISSKKIMLIFAIGSTLFFALMLVSEGAFMIIASVILVGFCMAPISPIIYGSSAPYTNKFPLAMGVLFTIGCMGGTIMPLITGFIAEYYGFDGGMSAILITFVLLIIFAVINLRQK